MVREGEAYGYLVTEQKIIKSRGRFLRDKPAIPRMREIIYSAGLFKHCQPASKS